jgi:orotate phosphoribosyltransferase
MNAARVELDGLAMDIEYGVVYVKPGNEHMVDYTYQPLGLPRLFEWNVFHSYWAKQACFDIDGVLCRDPTNEENDDGSRYELFLKTATPRYLPSVKIPAIVTSRLERYRPQTELWLRQHRVDYDKLIMHPARNKKERIRAGNHALRKAEVYKNGQYKLFIESSQRQARSISKLTKKPVLCTDTNELYGG